MNCPLKLKTVTKGIPYPQEGNIIISSQMLSPYTIFIDGPGTFVKRKSKVDANLYEYFSNIDIVVHSDNKSAPTEEENKISGLTLFLIHFVICFI